MTDLLNWNKIEKSNQIEVDQLLRVQAPASEVAADTVAKPVNLNNQATKPLTAASLPKAPASAASTSAAATANLPKPVSSASAAKPEDTNITGKPTSEVNEALGQRWVWPAPGRVMAAFNSKTNKGIDIRGKRGDAVYSSADGRVSIAGVELPGYGKLVLIKHSDNLLSAYGFLDQVKVSEGELIRRGQVIATMGVSPGGEEALHFEVRRSGSPIDPLEVLPK